MTEGSSTDTERQGGLPPTAARAAGGAPPQDADFEQEALPWVDDVYRFARSLTRNDTDAEDVVQDTYLRAYKSWHTFQPGSDARRWLFAIARNVFLRSRERVRPEVDPNEGDIEKVDSSTRLSGAGRDTTEALLSRIDLGPALNEAMDQLAEPFRSAVVLVDIEDQSYDAAAQVLGVPVGTVRSRLFRGRRLLQEMLMDYAQDAGYKSAVRQPEPVHHD
jgi:RNA polymerase sigma-70 factor (ECF subfamily)